MKICVLGPGAIGSTFAYRLAQAGHDLTVVARGERLRWLEQERAIVVGNGERAPVSVQAALDEAVAWDLVLVTVLAPQVAAVLQSLRRCAARNVMFMFNTFESIEPLRTAVGAERFAFGFPQGVFAMLIGGRLHPKIRKGTTVSDTAWVQVFSDAGIPTVVDDDMQSWLRTHAATVAPLMSMGTKVFARRGGVSWREAAAHVDGLIAGASIVRAVGSELRPAGVRSMVNLPRVVLTLMAWLFSRTKIVRDLGALGTAEPRMLIDMMSVAAPGLAGPLQAIRP